MTASTTPETTAVAPLVLVTREEDEDGPLSQELRQVGCRVVLHSVLATTAPPSWDSFDHAWEKRSQVAWICFTSRRAVEGFRQRLQTLGGRLSDIAHCQVACVGPATAQAWEAMGGSPPLLPKTSHVEALAQALILQEDSTRCCYWLPQALQAREVLAMELEQAGAIVWVTPVYQTMAASIVDAQQWRTTLARGIDWISFASPSAVTHWFAEITPVEWRRLERIPRIACIGPTTAAAVTKLQLPVDVIATPHSFAGLAQAIADQARPSALSPY